ncbi:MAG: KamA family radical SAM protein [Planctomycetes bacterium]|nr:KamA family radical SAM protein [Planctomycetota bacterium]MCB9917674.1 KamA family radical SAM protein [Planctomycetota bacterium]
MILDRDLLDRLATTIDWNDWRWQMRNSIRSVEALQNYATLDDAEVAELETAGSRFRWSVTPYVLSLIDDTDPRCPIRRQHLPSGGELAPDFGSLDPLQEGTNSPTKSVVHVYEDRVAFKVVNVCPTYCRYCFREYFVKGSDTRSSQDSIREGLDYIASRPAIRDVLLTGGDPLMMSDERIDGILTELRAMPHVEIVRIGSRTPCTLPQRITDGLVAMLRKHQPLWLNTHFNHPDELTPEASRALNALADAGIPIGNQSVLLAGINDSIDVMKRLCEQLLRVRVRPYYVYQCQTLEGTAHLRVPIERGIEIMDGLRGNTTGFGIPTYVLDTPDGKVPLSASWFVRRDGDEVLVRTPRGRIWREHNPVGRPDPTTTT